MGVEKAVSKGNGFFNWFEWSKKSRKRLFSSNAESSSGNSPRSKIPIAIRLFSFLVNMCAPYLYYASFWKGHSTLKLLILISDVTICLF